MAILFNTGMIVMPGKEVNQAEEAMLTLSKIAKEPGVCKATVSLVLNGKAQDNRISKATIQKVSAYCRERNYMPNIHASRMWQEVVQNIMVLLNASGSNSGGGSTFIDYNVNRILEVVSVQVEECGYSVTLHRCLRQL